MDIPCVLVMNKQSESSKSKQFASQHILLGNERVQETASTVKLTNAGRTFIDTGRTFTNIDCTFLKKSCLLDEQHPNAINNDIKSFFRKHSQIHELIVDYGNKYDIFSRHELLNQREALEEKLTIAGNVLKINKHYYT